MAVLVERGLPVAGVVDVVAKEDDVRDVPAPPHLDPQAPVGVERPLHLAVPDHDAIRGVQDGPAAPPMLASNFNPSTTRCVPWISQPRVTVAPATPLT